MASSFPGALDALSNPTTASNLSDGSVLHSAQHANANDAVEAVQATLGVNPQGTAGTVGARIAAVEGATGTGLTSASVVLFVRKAAGGWGATVRPTSDGSILVLWDGVPDSGTGAGPAVVASGTGGMRPGDKWLSHP